MHIKVIRYFDIIMMIESLFLLTPIRVIFTSGNRLYSVIIINLEIRNEH